MTEPVAAEIREVANDNGTFTYVKMSAKPEGVPDKFWNAEHGLNLTALNKGYTTLESSRAQFVEETRANLTAELAPKVPATYEIKPPTVEGAPDGWNFNADEDPVVTALKALGPEINLTQESFDKLLAKRAGTAVDEYKTLGRRTRETLGENYAERINRVSAKLKEVLGENEAGAIAAAVSDPLAVIALEKLVGGNGLPTAGGAAPATGLTEEKLRVMMRDPRYHDPMKREPAFVREIEEGFRHLYGDAKTDGNIRWTSGG